MSGGAYKPSERPGDLEVPELEFAAKPSAGPASGKTPKTAAAPPPPEVSGGGYGGDFDFDDDMELDRNAMPTLEAVGAPARPAGGFSGGRIELGANVVPDNTIAKGSHAKVEPRTNWGGGILSTLLVGIFAGGSGYGLFRYVHRPAGWNVGPLAQKALDGGSALWSGGASMGFLALCITFTIMAMYAKPRSLGYGAAAVGTLIIGVTFMIITFSVGPDGAPEVPPDGAKLVPWLISMVPLGIAFRMLRNAWDKCFEGEARFQGVVLAAFAAGAAFVGVELLFGAGIGRLFTLFT
jgi:hypothetical protein